MLSFPCSHEEYEEAATKAYHALMDTYRDGRIGMTVTESIGWPRMFEEPWNLTEAVHNHTWCTLSDKGLAYARLSCLGSLRTFSGPVFQEHTSKERMAGLQTEVDHLIENEKAISKEIQIRQRQREHLASFSD